MKLSQKWLKKQFKFGFVCKSCKEPLDENTDISKWQWTGTEWKHKCPDYNDYSWHFAAVAIKGKKGS